MKRFFLLAFLVAAAVAGYQWRAEISQMAGLQPPAKPSAPAQPAQARTEPVVMAPVEARDMPVQVATIGRVQAIATVGVKPRVDGEIAEVAFREGQDVKAGEVLFVLDRRSAEATLRAVEANLARDRAQAQQARAEVRRASELTQRDFVSRQRYDQLETTAAVQEAVVRATEAAVENARLTLSYMTIRAPIDGRTGAVALKKGNVVRAADTGTLVTITQIRPIYVSFTATQKDLAEIRRADDQAEIRVEATIPEDTGPAMSGIVTFVDNNIDAATGTIALKATMPNADSRLWPGQFVNVVATLRTEKNAITVPAAALQVGQNGDYLYVVKPDMTASVRTVKVSRVVGERAVIREGLQAGERVVVEGQLRLTEGTRVRDQRAAPATRTPTS
ncbi:multidrug efflux system membrane fusion protein [Stella humosa]|uniref:Multidrug efflux system membrane fusion protein n=1 Tax=Stella humosa TaxID=94 RepID=A0A3N1MF83_9PROT|nr:efflux RND transporter periplasmic adaptor subunit [Stella humosa]ROQ01785.1 multidrug efflux system membrane fusion protein [Stella humosa]BBK32171.1 RND transporter [Stella humosa]